MSRSGVPEGAAGVLAESTRSAGGEVGAREREASAQTTMCADTHHVSAVLHLTSEVYTDLGGSVFSNFGYPPKEHEFIKRTSALHIHT